MSLISELKRRNVFRVAVAYTVIAWLLAQVADLAFDNFGTPDWVPKTFLFLLALGFPLAIFFAWAFELTPDGVRREVEVDPNKSVTPQTGRKLDYLIIAVLVVAVGFLLSDKFGSQESAEPEQEVAAIIAEEDKSVAVLPFVAMSSGPDDEYFADGLTEEILNSLAQLPELLVTARTSAFSFKGQDVPIPEIAAKLQVAHVVEGSVRRAGEQLRITAQLIRASDGFHLWSETYDRSAEDSFGVQTEIAEKIAATLDVVLDDDTLASMRSSGLQNPEAFIAYQKGSQLAAHAHEVLRAETAPILLEANGYFETVIELAPDFSPAHFEHADYYVHNVTALENTAENAAEIAASIEAAETDFRNAVRTARNEGDRLNAGLEQAVISQQWGRFRDLLVAANRYTGCIRPSWWGGIAAVMKASQDTLAMWQRAAACDPLNFYAQSNVARSYIALGDYQAAIEHATLAMELISHADIVDGLIIARMASGQFDIALELVERYVYDQRSRMLYQFYISAAQGDADTAAAILNERKETFGTVFSISQLAMLGDRQGANTLAAEADTAPLGYLVLLNAIGNCFCGAVFDLEVTPVFARMIEEAEMIWPPAAAIKAPVKDW
jgi:adenylate cyclase